MNVHESVEWREIKWNNVEAKALRCFAAYNIITPVRAMIDNHFEVWTLSIREILLIFVLYISSIKIKNRLDQIVVIFCLRYINDHENRIFVKCNELVHLPFVWVSNVVAKICYVI